MRDSSPVRRDRCPAGCALHGDGKLMADSRDSEIETTKASAQLPGLDIEIVHRQSPNNEWEQVSINIRAMPSFEGLGRSFEMADPLTLWMQAAQLMWMPWLLTAQTMMLPDSLPRALTTRQAELVRLLMAASPQSARRQT